MKALKQNGAVVAMTGDGVNDAPALKAGELTKGVAAAGRTRRADRAEAG